MPSTPQISVCMATCNGGKFIARQLQTILSQLSAGDEVVISDDSSTDDTLAIVERFADPRIRLFPGQIFCSPTYNFENALNQARGEIIFLSDQDDEWVEGWVEAALVELQHASLVVCDAHVMDFAGTLQPTATVYSGIRKPGVIRNFYRNGYMGSCCAFRREILSRALPFPPHLPWHDWWLGLIADAFFRSTFLPRKMVRHRLHDSNASPTGQTSTYSLARKISMRWHIFVSLANRVVGWKFRQHQKS
jgi:glycosyltransferase involved in cell wall biosynthesis